MHRYLRGFGPADLRDVANWAGVPTAKIRLAAERIALREFRDEDGEVLVDLPRIRIPPEDVPTPPRFLPTWDAALLGHAKRAGILPERFRERVFSTKMPQSVPTFLVDGSVAGIWRVERSGGRATLHLEPFEPLPRRALRELREEGQGLIRLVEPDADSYIVR